MSTQMPIACGALRAGLQPISALAVDGIGDDADAEGVEAGGDEGL